jgi:hypothetical protein
MRADVIQGHGLEGLGFVSAAGSWHPSGLSGSAVSSNTPIRRKRTPGCCARTVSGHASAAPPMSVMNSRLFIR